MSLAQAARPGRKVLQTIDVAGTNREATLIVVDFPVGRAEIKHTHPGEYVAYVLEGSLTFEVEGSAPVVLQKGDSLKIKAGQVHCARNESSAPAKLLVTFVLEKGKPLMRPVTP
jgi:quercetin dioxygenase-like cupin family protein